MGTTPANNWYKGTFGSSSFTYINKTGATQLRGIPCGHDVYDVQLTHTVRLFAQTGIASGPR